MFVLLIKLIGFHVLVAVAVVVANPPNQGHPTTILENICSEDDLRSRILGTFVVNSCLPASPRIFELPKNGIIAYF